MQKVRQTAHLLLKILTSDREKNSLFTRFMKRPLSLLIMLALLAPNIGVSCYAEEEKTTSVLEGLFPTSVITIVDPIGIVGITSTKATFSGISVSAGGYTQIHRHTFSNSTTVTLGITTNTSSGYIFLFLVSDSKTIIQSSECITTGSLTITAPAGTWSICVYNDGPSDTYITGSVGY